MLQEYNVTRTQCYKLTPQPAVPESQGWISGSHSHDSTTTILQSTFSKIASRCTMLGDEYFSRVYHDEFLAWYAQRAGHLEGLKAANSESVSFDLIVSCHGFFC